jgi:acyl dehydratase
MFRDHGKLAAMTDPAGGRAATRVLSETDLAAPIGDRYFEDYEPGEAYEYGYVLVDGAEMVEYARRFDPARRSRSKPDRGLVHTRGELLNQDGATALSLVAMNLLRLRNP